MVAIRPTTHLVGLALTTPHPPITMDHPSTPVEAHAWWGHHQARAGEIMATTGEMTQWEEAPTEGVTSTEEAVAVEESQASGAEDEEGPEEGTITWMVCGT